MSTARTHLGRTDAAIIDPMHERITIGAIIKAAAAGDAETVGQLRAMIDDGEAFIYPEHRRYWRIACGVIDDGERAVCAAVIHRLHARAEGDPNADADAVTECVESCVLPAMNGVFSAKIVRDLHRKREIADRLHRLTHDANNGTDWADVLAGVREFAEHVEAMGADDNPHKLLPVVNLIEQYPHLNRIIIDGVLRAGEVMNLIAAPKVGKSWMVYLIALSVAFGLKLWDTFNCTPGRVLILDYELHRPTIASRIKRVAEMMELDLSLCADRLDVVSLRGRRAPVDELHRFVPRGAYDLVIIDALYRAMPAGMDENSNSRQTDVYAALIAEADASDAAIIAVHHSTKGNQAEKAITDVGAGGGSQSRIVDAHLILREHEEPGRIVLDGVVRSFAPIEPLGLAWRFPLWERDYGIDPEALKGRKSRGEERQDGRDAEGKQTIRDALGDGPATVRALRTKTGISKGRVERLVDMMHADGELTVKTVNVRGNDTMEYDLAQ